MMTSLPRTTRRAYVNGLVMLFATGVFWSLNGALIKLIYHDGGGPHGVIIAFYRSLIAGLLLLPLARGRFHTLSRRSVRTRADSFEEGASAVSVDASASSGSLTRTLLTLRPAAIFCVLFFTVMTVCFVVGNTLTEAANVILLQYTSTFWIFALSPWLLREKPRMQDVSFLAVAVAGIGVIFVGQASADLAGLAVALTSGLFFGLLTLMIRIMRDSDAAAVMVLNLLGSALLLLPVALVVGGLWVTPRELILLLLLGVVQFGGPYYLYTLALRRVPAHQAALATLIEPVLVPVWTYLAVGETVSKTTIAGGALILGALLLFIRSARATMTVSPTVPTVSEAP